jgi:SAM-dependent methyltransferase
MGMLEKVKDYYNTKFLQYGKTVMGLGWGSTESQDKRFDLILNELSTYSKASLLDVGCGFGDLYKRIKTDKGWFGFNKPKINYYGIDISEYCINECKKLNKNFAHINLLEMSERYLYDWTYASGLFAVESDDWYKYTIQCLNTMINLSRRGVMVNFLYQSNKSKINTTNHFTTLAELEQIIYRLPIDDFVLIKNYLSHDITLKIKI